MQCRSCGVTIAAKALICYKCGTATTEAKYQPASRQRASWLSGLLPTAVALALLVAVTVYVERTSNGGHSSPAVTYVGVGVAVLIIGIRAYARRRR